jgi:hypothetical protein
LRTQTATIGDCSFEILTDGREFLGIGKAHIGRTLVRSGRLPLRFCTQTFTGLELGGLRLVQVKSAKKEVRIRLRALFRPLPVKLLRDHSFDPIHETGDWDATPTAGEGDVDIVLAPARDSFDGVEFRGFSYRYEYRSKAVPLFYIMDQASWELDGNILGATVVSQSSCSAPMVTFKKDTAWTTEGIIHWPDENSKANPVMTHNLPRWASHQAFDFQWKGSRTLIGVFERVALIRSILRREEGKPELKTFDKHIFDQSLRHRTPAKSILLNTDRKSETDQKNLWTRVFDETGERARAEFGLKEVPLQPRIHQNYWDNFIFNDYRRDLLPAAVALGFREVFIDNVHKSAATERCPHPAFHWNMCCGHEYEVAPRLGGPKALKSFVEDCKRLGIRPFSWTNNDQALSSPINDSERDAKGWFVRLEDTRMKFGGAYAGVMSVLDFGVEGARRYWMDCIKRTRKETGLDGYLFDSFYNLGFMPVSYRSGKPSTQWRGLIEAFKELQDAGVDFLIESFGPWGCPQHGCPVDYGFMENLFAGYKLSVGLGYTTIPSGKGAEYKGDVDFLYRSFAHMEVPVVTLFVPDGKGGHARLDRVWGDRHVQALRDYNDSREHMRKRFLQEDGKSVLWHDAKGARATLWNFEDREVALPGEIADLSAGRKLPKAGTYRLQACHTYAITGAEPLPTRVGRKA